MVAMGPGSWKQEERPGLLAWLVLQMGLPCPLLRFSRAGPELWTGEGLPALRVVRSHCLSSFWREGTGAQALCIAKAAHCLAYAGQGVLDQHTMGDRCIGIFLARPELDPVPPMLGGGSMFYIGIRLE